MATYIRVTNSDYPYADHSYKLEGWQNVLFELGSERVKVHMYKQAQTQALEPVHTVKFVKQAEAQKNGIFSIPCACFTRVNRD